MTFLNHGYFSYLDQKNKSTLARITLRHKISVVWKNIDRGNVRKCSLKKTAIN